jgi:hypothetical protein
LPREIERTHDIHLARVYLIYRRRFPELLNGWVFEEKLRLEQFHGERLPDALLRSASGEKVIEFGGAYSKAKLAAFHHFLSPKSIPYEVW